MMTPWLGEKGLRLEFLAPPPRLLFLSLPSFLPDPSSFSLLFPLPLLSHHVILTFSLLFSPLFYRFFFLSLFHFHSSSSLPPLPLSLFFVSSYFTFLLFFLFLSSSSALSSSFLTDWCVVEARRYLFWRSLLLRLDFYGHLWFSLSLLSIIFNSLLDFCGY